MVPKIERVTESCIVGEGPHWDAQTQNLYFVDVSGKNVLKFNPATNKLSKASVAPKQASFIIPVDGKKDQFVIALDKALTIISWDGESDQIIINETLCIADNSPEKADHKLNDGKCDSTGRLWTGTLGNTNDGIRNMPAAGTLYSLDSQRNLKAHVDKIRASNGLAFHELAKKMYYIDTLKVTIDQFDFNVAAGTISNRQVLFTLNKHDVPGFPDGMTIDTDGNLWVAIFGGSRIIKIDGSKVETLLDVVEMPALQVTSAAFGGPNLDELYVTTAALEFEGQKPKPPANGATYRVTGTGSKGFPGVSFKLD